MTKPVPEATAPGHDPLIEIRAAIQLVASGGADQVTITSVAAEQLLAQARALGRAAGVRVEPIWWTDEQGADLLIRPMEPSGER